MAQQSTTALLLGNIEAILYEITRMEDTVRDATIDEHDRRTLRTALQELHERAQTSS